MCAFFFRLKTSYVLRISDWRSDVCSSDLDWLGGGLPSATRLAGVCFARAGEHRWREQSAQRSSPPPLLSESEAADGEGAAVGETLSDLDRTYLAVQIADRRRFDALGNPAVAIADLDSDIFRST